MKIRQHSASDSPKIEARKTKTQGLGIFVVENIKKGEKLSSFDGRVYSSRSILWNEDLYNHCIQFEKKKWRDSKGIARLLNRSCEPNCGVKNFFDVVAMRDIKKGEEITWDYEMTEDHPYWRMKCTCGTKSCRKVIGAYSNMPDATRKKYKGFISEWLLGKKPRIKPKNKP